MPIASLETRPRWARSALGLVAWLAIGYASWYLALWLLGVPRDTSDGSASEHISRKMNHAPWTMMLIYLVLCVLVFHLLPWACRRWLNRTTQGGSDGHVAG